MRKNQTTKAIKYLFAALATAMLLAACGPQTLFTANVDVMTFLPSDDLQGDAPIQGGYDLKIPDENGLDSGDFNIPEEIFDNLQELKLELVTRFTLQEGVQALDANVAVHLSAQSPVFNDDPVIEFPFSLVPGEARDAPLTITVSEESDPTLFNLLKSGSFKLGVAYTSTGDPTNTGTMTSELVSFDLSLSTDIADLTNFGQ